MDRSYSYYYGNHDGKYAVRFFGDKDVSRVGFQADELGICAVMFGDREGWVRKEHGYGSLTYDQNYVQFYISEG